VSSKRAGYEALAPIRVPDKMDRRTLPWRPEEVPLYPYRCTQCGHSFEKIQSFSDEPETVCPKCGGKLERPLTVPGLQFKGAGWYVTDYASKSAPATGEAGDKKPSEAKPAAEEKSAKESKPTSTESASSAPATKPERTSRAVP
jgi:putative FmdB family regulatory protein